MKMLTKTTNCALERKRGGAGAQYFFSVPPPTFAPDRCPLPTFKFVPAPLLRNNFRQKWGGHAHPSSPRGDDPGNGAVYEHCIEYCRAAVGFR